MLLNKRQRQMWSSFHNSMVQMSLIDHFRERRRSRTQSHSALLQWSSAGSCFGKCLTCYPCMVRFSAVMQETWFLGMVDFEVCITQAYTCKKEIGHFQETLNFTDCFLNSTFYFVSGIMWFIQVMYAPVRQIIFVTRTLNIHLLDISNSVRAEVESPSEQETQCRGHPT